MLVVLLGGAAGGLTLHFHCIIHHVTSFGGNSLCLCVYFRKKYLKSAEKTRQEAREGGRERNGG